MMPNFLIIGAAKSGTTSLYDYLKQHPSIFLTTLKEPRFFALENKTINYQGPVQIVNQKAVTKLPDYHTLFDTVNDETAVGEASTVYLYDENTPSNIKAHIPECKLICVLRNPADRAFSSYAHMVRDGFETLSFEEGLAQEAVRIKDNWPPLWHYVTRGFYYEQVKRYFDDFEEQQIKVYLYEDLLHQPQWLVDDVFQFLEVDTGFKPDVSRKSNVSGSPRNKVISQMLAKDNWIKAVSRQLLPKSIRGKIYKSVKKKNLGKADTMKPETKKMLTELFREDITALETLIQRDLSHWLAPQ